MRREDYEARRIDIKFRLREIRKEMEQLQARFDKHADQLHDLRRQYVDAEKNRLMREAEQRSLDRD
jgi:hypothetical protein